MPQASVLKLWSEDQSAAGQERCRRMAAEVARVNGEASRGAYAGPHPSLTTRQGGSLREDFRGWRTDVA